ncbi:hypothetical protein PHYPSEUDO_014119 [Phytophthora pseudosyringae]|uniref:START domain-containing protein n=1 Tax=Phytophthora pseudosyringae TaxID=221518 RepID=A0A8T1W2B0_9STRA|nr:hypothetical protein PHYPSEUDO_014119 [Phytophthora pseudosyringae]
MIGSGLCRSPFQAISLTLTDQRELQGVAKTILDANFDRYLHFSEVDENAWKLIKGKGGMQVYSSRRRSQHPHTGRVDDNPDLQSLLCVGSAPGTLDDRMHGVLESATCPGAQDSSVNDFRHAAVLLRIKAPTALDPFATDVVKWMELDVRRRSMGLVKNRDYVYVEATGVKYLPSGEPLGFHVMHSVGIPQAHNLPGRVRAELSVCSFFRQVNKSCVSVYSMAILEPMSDRVRQVVVPRFVKTVLSTVKRADASKVKKFAQNLGKRYSELDHRRPPNGDQNCITCTRRVWRLAKLTSRHNTCVVCCGCICNACKIEKKLKVAASDRKVATKKAAFCFSCLTDVMTANGSEFSFAEDSAGGPELNRSAYHSVWSTRLPSWNIAKNIESSPDFASTR